MRAVPRLCELYPGICLPAEEKARKNLRPVDESKKKMENLLSSLRREKVKMRKSSGTGKSEYF
jgi:hypothetical protein